MVLRGLLKLFLYDKVHGLSCLVLRVREFFLKCEVKESYINDCFSLGTLVVESCHLRVVEIFEFVK